MITKITKQKARKTRRIQIPGLPLFYLLHLINFFAYLLSDNLHKRTVVGKRYTAWITHISSVTDNKLPDLFIIRML